MMTLSEIFGTSVTSVTSVTSATSATSAATIYDHLTDPNQWYLAASSPQIQWGVLDPNTFQRVFYGQYRSGIAFAENTLTDTEVSERINKHYPKPCPSNFRDFLKSKDVK